MVKSFITVIIASLLIVVGAWVENYNVKKNFSALERLAQINQEKALQESITQADIDVFQDTWIDCKKTLHIWIPHNEIKEIELWVSEAVACVRNEKYPDVAEKLEVVIELCEQVPHTFRLQWSNIL